MKITQSKEAEELLMIYRKERSREPRSLCGVRVRLKRLKTNVKGKTFYLSLTHQRNVPKCHVPGCSGVGCLGFPDAYSPAHLLGMG